MNIVDIKDLSERAKKQIELHNKESKKNEYRATFVYAEEVVNTDLALFSELYRLCFTSSDTFDIFLPNEILFDEKILTAMPKWKHRAFFLSYYYLSSFMYRNLVHSKIAEVSMFSPTNLKRLLSAGRISQTYDYIVKKKGMLEQLGWTVTERDYPIYFNIENGEIVDVVSLIQARNDGYILDDLPKTFYIHKPLKAFYRYENNDDQKYFDGHFFDYKETIKVLTEAFVSILSNKVLGFSGFYFYCYLRYKSNQIFFKKYRGMPISHEKIAKDIGLRPKTLQNFTRELKQMGLIDVQHRVKKSNVFLASNTVKEIILT
jgi:hypothetical protein